MIDWIKIDGKWKPRLDAKFLFEMYTSHGCDPEDVLEFWNQQSKGRRLSVLFNSWLELISTGVVSKKEIRENKKRLKENKGDVVLLLQKIYE